MEERASSSRRERKSANASEGASVNERKTCDGGTKAKGPESLDRELHEGEKNDERTYLPDACIGRCAGHEVRVYHFVGLDTLGRFKIIQMYAAMVAHLRLARATPTRPHVLLLLRLRRRDSRRSMPSATLVGASQWRGRDVHDENLPTAAATTTTRGT